MKDSIIDHLSIGVKDFEKSKRFYLEILNCLGYKKLMQFSNHAAFGQNRSPSFWISGDTPPTPNLHFSFVATSHKAVDDFFNKAIELGAIENGKPGLRDYAPNYYAAYVIDYDGHKIEAVCRK